MNNTERETIREKTAPCLTLIKIGENIHARHDAIKMLDTVYGRNLIKFVKHLPNLVAGASNAAMGLTRMLQAVSRVTQGAIP